MVVKRDQTRYQVWYCPKLRGTFRHSPVLHTQLDASSHGHSCQEKEKRSGGTRSSMVEGAIRVGILTRLQSDLRIHPDGSAMEAIGN